MTDAEFEAFFEDAMRFFEQLIAEIRSAVIESPLSAGDAAATVTSS
ncbi:MAG: hypothetical protein AAF684_05690 [Pseudomonadota bacterium]